MWIPNTGHRSNQTITSCCFKVACIFLDMYLSSPVLISSGVKAVSEGWQRDEEDKVELSRERSLFLLFFLCLRTNLKAYGSFTTDDVAIYM